MLSVLAMKEESVVIFSSERGVVILLLSQSNGYEIVR